MLGFQGIPYGGDDFYTAQVLSSIIGGGMSSRLFQEVREKRGLCYSIYAFHWSFADTGVFGVHAATGPEDVDELMPVIVDELERAADSITDKEVEARPGAASRRPADDARKPGRARRAARAPAAALRPHHPARGAGRADRGDRRVDARPRPRRRIFSGSAPTLASVGPVNGMIGRDRIADRFGAPCSTE